MENNAKHMRRCALCKNRHNYKTYKFFKTPVCHLKRQRWIDACGVHFKDNDLICQSHFAETDFINGPGCAGMIRLQPGAVPQLRASTPDPLYVEDSMEPPVHFETDLTHMNSSTQTISNSLEESFREEIMALRDKVDRLEEENASLRKQLQEQ